MNLFDETSTAEEVTAGLNLRNKVILITGCNTGLGLETARALALRGATLVALARTREKAEGALSDSGAQGLALACELSEPQSVLQCIEQLRDSGLILDVVLCNAGIMALPKPRVERGLELQFRTNHLGHFVLVTGLLPQLSRRARVVLLSSAAHFSADRQCGINWAQMEGQDYEPWRQYAQTKLCNLLFARSLGQRFAAEKGAQRTANAVHPGVIHTQLGRYMDRELFEQMAPKKFKSVAQGAATQCFVAVQPRGGQLNGTYFANCREAKSSRFAKDDQLAAQLWQRSEHWAANWTE